MCHEVTRADEKSTRSDISWWRKVQRTTWGITVILERKVLGEIEWVATPSKYTSPSVGIHWRSERTKELWGNRMSGWFHLLWTWCYDLSAASTTNQRDTFSCVDPERYLFQNEGSVRRVARGQILNDEITSCWPICRRRGLRFGGFLFDASEFIDTLQTDVTNKSSIELDCIERYTCCLFGTSASVTNTSQKKDLHSSSTSLNTLTHQKRRPHQLTNFVGDLVRNNIVNPPIIVHTSQSEWESGCRCICAATIEKICC